MNDTAEPSTPEYGPPAFATGGRLTVMFAEMELVAPWLSVTCRVTVYVPPVAYWCDGFWALDVPPSPNVQL